MFESNCLTLVPAFEVAAIDSSGAGDTFVGTFAAALAGGAELPTAVIHASAAGALSVLQKGAATSPGREALNAFLNSRADPAIAQT